MLYQKTNEYGVISVDNTFLNQLIKDALKPFEGRAWKANYKGRSQDFLIKLGNFDALSEQVIKESDKGIYIKIYLIVKFGISLGAVTSAIIDSLADILLNDLEAKIDDIEVVISGMIMTKGIVKREIVYSYNKKGQQPTA
ncbi:MAG: hypothetical protein J6W58_10015 [Lachnospiraceae bacterium]|nr:hypothetical protein [Lachnospiraceae bacterium]